MTQQTVVLIAVFAIPVLFAITLHEVAHGWAAKQFGDRTAEMLGRLTLNPFRHIDPIGTVLVPVAMLMFTNFVFGWARPVPITTANMRRPRHDMVWVAAAGPAANVVMALGWAILLSLVQRFGDPSSGIALGVGMMAQAGIFINVILAVFNMLPIPPLDGGRVVSNLVSPRTSVVFDRIEPYGILIVLALLFTGILWPILQPLIAGLSAMVRTIAGVA
jgi:Zn-dependent protease